MVPYGTARSGVSAEMLYGQITFQLNYVELGYQEGFSAHKKPGIVLWWVLEGKPPMLEPSKVAQGSKAVDRLKWQHRPGFCQGPLSHVVTWSHLMVQREARRSGFFLQVLLSKAEPNLEFHEIIRGPCKIPGTHRFPLKPSKPGNSWTEWKL